MLSTVLHSARAIQVNIAIMRVFVRLREMMAAHKELALQLRELEGRIQDHDEQIVAIFDAIRQLMSSPVSPRKKDGLRGQRAEGSVWEEVRQRVEVLENYTDYKTYWKLLKTPGS